MALINEIVFFEDALFRISAWSYHLEFKYPFRLARNSRTFTEIIFLQIQSPHFVSFGEAALPPYLGEDKTSVLQFFKSVNWQSVLHNDLMESLKEVDAVKENNNAAKAAIDIGLHDYYSKKANQRLSEYLEIAHDKPIYSTFTVGISTEDEFKQKLKDGEDFKIIKLKLGSDDDKAILSAYKDLTHKPFCADINGGYSSRDEAAKMCEYLTKQGALFIEQPLPADWLEEMAWVKERVDAVFIADESMKRLGDLKYAHEAFNGVNIKLMKSTGIYEAMQMFKELRAKNMKIILGAMAESSLGNTAASHLAPLADWVDLDGPKLSSNDPFEGITYRQGEIIIPDRAGVGALLKK